MTRLREWLEAEPTLRPGEVQRGLHALGTPLALSPIYRLLGPVRATIPVAVIVRFEGVAGEFAQCDSGVADVRLTTDTPTARVEPLVRASRRVRACRCASSSTIRTPSCCAARPGDPCGMRHSPKPCVFATRRFHDLTTDLPQQLA